MQCSLRLKKELERFRTQPVSGISCWPTDNIYQLKASVMGPDGTPYENGVFYIDIQIPDKYPFIPPNVRFVTPIYHPNVDDSGRICLPTLKSAPQGAWKPNMNLASILVDIQLLMAEPNFNDPLRSEISQEYQTSRESYIKHARECTVKHALQSSNELPGIAVSDSCKQLSSSVKHAAEDGDSPNSKKKKV
ncbi:ubiquitin-conjugating enzyme E2 T-like isoform X1 [Argiope bruennichi]|uniref:ubiquitin-conjugating enzyme E2 T-like isoform X1 n=2 Tax=Argiope bruennichi TaxID=94029 RepID=UPI002493E92E|nr:ubiquitin-conjugating enzyme E2 T-like isoform X1 [Argiope bruennichi]XP_055937769.1 ubiquitin-conjugating enzyme E2 T-like isoform X1 [Argiope bruennichi]